MFDANNHRSHHSNASQANFKMWKKESQFDLKLLNQIFIFINLYSSIVWCIASVVVLYKDSFESASFNFPLICFCIGCPVEGLRIYLGYSGNIRNDVRRAIAKLKLLSTHSFQVLDLAGFLILSTFIELPIHIYWLLSLYNTFYHIAFMIQTMQLILLPIEIIINFIIIRGSLHERNLQFQMMFGTEEKLSEIK